VVLGELSRQSQILLLVLVEYLVNALEDLSINYELMCQQIVPDVLADVRNVIQHVDPFT